MLRLVLIFVLCLMSCGANAVVRIKDIAALQGVRDNQLVGYGLVVGLQNTGDSLRNSTFTQQALQSMLDRLGVNVRGDANMRTLNVAAVLVTADLPPFITPGTRIDVNVSSLGDATSLMGGTLILTSLTGVDGQTYAIAQGQVNVSGFSAGGKAQTVTQNVPTAGRIPNGALVEREVPGQFRDLGPLTLELKNPDFNTAVRVADAINAYTRANYGVVSAQEEDQRSVRIAKPSRVGSARFMAEIGELLVQPDMPARVVVDARSGTVVIGQDVQVSTVAVTYGNVTVRITETPNVSQPAPYSRGRTVVTPQTQIDVAQQGGHIAIVHGANLRTLVAGLNQIGLRPAGIIAILQAIKTAGALQADLVVE
ncbi:MAG TPA: flagellar basal body P-ring protein FlgI [Methylovirgula sp.]